jgi:Kef-type K+ transport system membrane component KefB
MNEHDSLVFLLSLAAILAAARVVGELARWLSMPLVVGEIAAGIGLGPTALGRVAPSTQRWLFPHGAAQSMIGGYSTIAVVLLLVVVGLEVDLGVLRRRGRSAALTGLLGMLLPFASGVVLAFLLPDSDLLDPSRCSSESRLASRRFP